MIRAQLTASGLGKEFWAEAANTSTYLKNRLPHSAVMDQTPYEALTGNKPSILHLQPFGRECYIHIPKAKRKPGSKLSPKAYKGVFVGYTDTTRHYRIYNLDEKRTMVTGDVFFPPLPAEGAPTTSNQPGSAPLTPRISGKELVQPHSLNFGPTTPPTKEYSDDSLWLEWMDRNPNSAWDLYELGNPQVI